MRIVIYILLYIIAPEIKTVNFNIQNNIISGLPFNISRHQYSGINLLRH